MLVIQTAEDPQIQVGVQMQNPAEDPQL